MHNCRRHIVVKKLITILLFFAFFLNGSLLQAKRIVEIKGKAEVRIVGITPEEAWRIAIRRARANAIEKAYGIQIVGSTVVKNGNLVGEYIKTLMKGLIIHESIIEQEKGWIEGITPPIPFYKVIINAKVVVPEHKRKIRLFTAELNKDSFLAGEKAQITISASSNVYIGIFNITAEDKVIMLYPNPHIPYKMITPGKKYVFPDPDSDVYLKITIIKGHKKDTEAFFIVGLPGKKEYRNVFDIFKTKETYKLTEFFKLFHEAIDIDIVTDRFLPYSIEARKRK